MENPSNSNFIERLENKNIPVTWNFLLIGLMGPGVLPNQLSCAEIASYAVAKLTEDCKNSMIENIAYSEMNEKQEVENNLRLLASEENKKSKLTDLKKWQLLLLEDLLDTLSEDPIKGLTDLTSFWSQFDFPTDSPHEVQGIHNYIPPETYYTRETYQRLIKHHKEWIEKTERNLRCNLE